MTNMIEIVEVEFKWWKKVLFSPNVAKTIQTWVNRVYKLLTEDQYDQEMKQSFLQYNKIQWSDSLKK